MTAPAASQSPTIMFRSAGRTGRQASSTARWSAGRRTITGRNGGTRVSGGTVAREGDTNLLNGRASMETA
jgi:hypothetical protein